MNVAGYILLGLIVFQLWVIGGTLLRMSREIERFVRLYVEADADS
jgi:hypothetical protein